MKKGSSGPIPCINQSSKWIFPNPIIGGLLVLTVLSSRRSTPSSIVLLGLSIQPIVGLLGLIVHFICLHSTGVG